MLFSCTIKVAVFAIPGDIAFLSFWWLVADFVISASVILGPLPEPVQLAELSTPSVDVAKTVFMGNRLYSFLDASVAVSGVELVHVPVGPDLLATAALAVFLVSFLLVIITN